MVDNANSGYGQLSPTDLATEYNSREFVVTQLLARFRTISMVKVLLYIPGIGLEPGTVNCQVMVNMIDGVGNATEHGTIFNMAYVRLQGGLGAVIADPAKGDIGLALVCDRDISAVVQSGQISNPGSTRIADLADGVYLGGVINPIPTNYIQVLDALGSINLVALGKVNILAPGGLWVNGVLVTVP